MADAETQRENRKEKNKQVVRQWKAFANDTGQIAYEELMDYIDEQRDMFRQYAEERQMPSPNGDGKVPIDNDTVAVLLQTSRGLNIVKTYIESRVEADVSTT